MDIIARTRPLLQVIYGCGCGRGLYSFLIWSGDFEDSGSHGDGEQGDGGQDNQDYTCKWVWLA